jgi:hypothetical protein
MTTTRRHYAIPDPDDPGQMTYWYDGERGLTPWPPKARYGPVLFRKDLPEDRAAREAVLAEFRRHFHEWWAAVRAAIAADPVAAGRRFAELTTNCCWCGRQLTEESSKVYGIGPECRKDMSADVLAAYALRVGCAHAGAA